MRYRGTLLEILRNCKRIRERGGGKKEETKRALYYVHLSILCLLESSLLLAIMRCMVWCNSRLWRFPKKREGIFFVSEIPQARDSDHMSIDESIYACVALSHRCTYMRLCGCVRFCTYATHRTSVHGDVRDDSGEQPCSVGSSWWLSLEFGLLSSAIRRERSSSGLSWRCNNAVLE